jgi:carbon monoxide dehydrogenase subunit G
MANHSKVSVTINQPVETVWDKLMNPDNLKFWLTGFVSVEHISGDYGKTGSVSKLKFLERGKEMEVTETAVLVKPNQQYTFNMTSTAFDIDTDIRLISFGNRTEMIQTVQFFPKQFLVKLFMPLIKGAMKKRMENELIRFKNFVETKT